MQNRTLVQNILYHENGFILFVIFVNLVIMRMEQRVRHFVPYFHFIVTCARGPTNRQYLHV